MSNIRKLIRSNRREWEQRVIVLAIKKTIKFDTIDRWFVNEVFNVW